MLITFILWVKKLILFVYKSNENKKNNKQQTRGYWTRNYLPQECKTGKNQEGEEADRRQTRELMVLLK